MRFSTFLQSGSFLRRLAPWLASFAFLLVAQSASAAPNLIANPSLETASPTSSSTPNAWFQGSWGTLNATFAYPVAGYSSGTAAKVTVTSRTSGDAKWYFAPVAIAGTSTLVFSNSYQSTATSTITAQFQLANGSYQYQDLGVVGPSASWKTFQTSVTPPVGVTNMTVFHLLATTGTLTVDNFSLSKQDPLPPPPPSNLIQNGTFETTDVNPAMPLAWKKNAWGTNSSTFAYPVPGSSSPKAAKVTMSSYVDGDAKWYFDAVPLSASSSGVYTFTDDYQSTAPTIITLQYTLQDNSLQYVDIATLPASPTWKTSTSTFFINSNVKKISVFHRLASVGSLAIDNAILTKIQGGTFSQGMVSFTFDDGLTSQYENAVPKLNAAGMKGSFFIITQSMAGFPNMTPAQVQEVYAQGHEISSHTRSHPFLTEMTDAELQSEIAGSRQDLISMGIHPVDTFVYPYGDYNDHVKQKVRDSGYTGARSVGSGYNVKLSDKFALLDQHLEVNTTFGDVKSWVDQALADKTWLILEGHDVDHSGDQYSITPELMQQIVDYIKSKNMKVVTFGEGIQMMGQ